MIILLIATWKDPIFFPYTYSTHKNVIQLYTRLHEILLLLCWRISWNCLTGECVSIICSIHDYKYIQTAELSYWWWRTICRSQQAALKLVGWMWVTAHLSPLKLAALGTTLAALGGDRRRMRFCAVFFELFSWYKGIMLAKVGGMEN